MTAANGETADIEVAGHKLTVPNADRPKGPAKIVIRPHQIRLARKGGKTGFDGVISYAASLGNQIQYTVDGALGRLFVISNSAANPLVVGDSISIHFEASDIRLVAE